MKIEVKRFRDVADDMDVIYSKIPMDMRIIHVNSGGRNYALGIWRSGIDINSVSVVEDPKGQCSRSTRIRCIWYPVRRAKHNLDIWLKITRLKLQKKEFHMCQMCGEDIATHQEADPNWCGDGEYKQMWFCDHCSVYVADTIKADFEYFLLQERKKHGIAT
jgi:hypothetical protein